MDRAPHGCAYTWRWTGETVEMVFVHDPPSTVEAGAGHDPRCTTLATVRRADGTLIDVPFTTLKPAFSGTPDHRRFRRLPHPERSAAA